MAQNGYYPLMFLCSLRCPLTMKPSLGSRTTCIVVGGTSMGVSGYSSTEVLD
ncbi:hypothetical protein B0H12DRAFT_1170685, partial [Mycena haematopus]